MSALVLIWTTAAALTLGALLWMTSLIVLRLVYERRAEARARSRRQVETALVRVIQNDEMAIAQLAPFSRRARLMAEVLLEFFGIIRGHDQARVLTALRNLGVDTALRRRLDRGSLRGRLVSIEALGVFPGPETEAALRTAMRSRSPRLRLAAVRSLAAVGGNITIGHLLDDLATGALRPSGAFGEFIRAVVAADTSAAILAARRSDLSPTARAILLESLGEAGDYNALPQLVGDAEAPDLAVRVAAIQAMGRLRHPVAEAALSKALSDVAWPVRAAACEAIGAARLEALEPALSASLADPVWRVRFQAAAALAKLGARGLASLQAAAESPLDAVRTAASLTIAERGV